MTQESMWCSRAKLPKYWNVPTENKREPPLFFLKEVQTAQLPWKTGSLRTAHALDSPGEPLGEESGWVPSGEGGTVLLGEQCSGLDISLCNGEIGFPSDRIKCSCNRSSAWITSFPLCCCTLLHTPSTYIKTSPKSSQKLPTKHSYLVVKTISWIGSAVPTGEQGTKRGHRFIQSYVKTVYICKLTKELSLDQ